MSYGKGEFMTDLSAVCFTQYYVLLFLFPTDSSFVILFVMSQQEMFGYYKK